MQRINERIELIRKRVNNFEKMINSVSKNHGIDKSFDISPIKPITYYNRTQKSSNFPNNTQQFSQKKTKDIKDAVYMRNRGIYVEEKKNYHQTPTKTEIILECGSPSCGALQPKPNVTQKIDKVKNTIFDPNEPLTDSEDGSNCELSLKNIATNTVEIFEKSDSPSTLKNNTSPRPTTKCKQIKIESDSDSDDLDIEAIRRRVLQRRQKINQSNEICAPVKKYEEYVENISTNEKQNFKEDDKFNEKSIKPIRTSQDIDREFKSLFSDANRSEYARKHRDNFLEFWVDEGKDKGKSSKSSFEEQDDDLIFSISESNSEKNSTDFNRHDDTQSGYKKYALTDEEKRTIFSDYDDMNLDAYSDSTGTDDNESLEELLEVINPMDVTPTPIITPTKDMHVTVHTPKGSVVISPRKCPQSPPVSSFIPKAALVPSPRAGEKGRAVFPDSPPGSSDEEFFGSDEENIEEEDELLSWRKDPSVLDFDSLNSSLTQQLALIDDIDDGSA